VPPVRRPGFVRVAAVLAVVGALGACGTPSGFDHQEQVAFSRECASLIERNLTGGSARKTVVGDTPLDLGQPDAFYKSLETIRGPGFFRLDAPENDARTPRDMFDNCNTKVPFSLFPTGATTTTTTVPGS
jgi:hypothetical protein